MELQDFVLLLEQVHGALMQVIGMMKATVYKKNKEQTPTKQKTQYNIFLKNWRPDDNCSAPVFLPRVASAVLQEEGKMKYKGKTIAKRKDGRWCARYRIDGKVKSVYGHTQAECLTKLKEALKQPTRKNNPKITDKTKLGEWITKWLELYKTNKLKKSTLEQMKRYLKSVKPIAEKRLSELSAIDLQEWLNDIDAPRKREKLYVMIKDALNKAVKNKLIKDNPMDAVDKPKIQRKQSQALNKEDEERFVAVCHELPQGNLYLMCLYEGLRLGEAMALTWSDINFEKRTITINKNIERDGTLGTPKTATSNRIIPLFSKTNALLHSMKRGKDNERIFPDAMKTYQNHIARLSKQLGLDGVHVHTLRHTFATRCAEAGIAVKVVQKWLGHSTVQMTLNVYTHVNPDFEAEMVEKFDTHFDTHFN